MYLVCVSVCKYRVRGYVSCLVFYRQGGAVWRWRRARGVDPLEPLIASSDQRGAPSGKQPGARAMSSSSHPSVSRREVRLCSIQWNARRNLRQVGKGLAQCRSKGRRSRILDQRSPDGRRRRHGRRPASASPLLRLFLEPFVGSKGPTAATGAPRCHDARRSSSRR